MYSRISGETAGGEGGSSPPVASGAEVGVGTASVDAGIAGSTTASGAGDKAAGGAGESMTGGATTVGSCMVVSSMNSP